MNVSDSLPPIKSAEILAVGTELLMGHTVNTNASYLARQLALLGIPSYRQVVVGDNPERLRAQILDSAGRCDLLLLSGGLGPTADDITMKVAAEAAGRALVFDEASYEAILDYFAKTKRSMCLIKRKQAMLPEESVILPNTNGTAPGAIFTLKVHKNDEQAHACTLVLLPGPPSELVPMFEQSVQPILSKRTPYHLRSAFVRLIGIGESAAEDKIQDLIDGQNNPTIAPYAAEGECMFRITERVDKEEQDLISPVIEIFRERFGTHIYEVGSRTLPEVVVDLLKARGATVSFAESCTAGMISASLGDIPGVSDVFMGSVVSYDNNVKEKVLGVRRGTLESHGAVSSECAQEMAVGVRERLGTDYAVSVTGIAGPGGGSEDKPVGLVYIAVCDATSVMVEEFHFAGNRARIRKNATLSALDLLRKRLL